MTGPAAEQSEIETEEHELRAEFCRWLYFDKYSKTRLAGTLARQIHRADSFACDVLRNRASMSWVRQIAKRGWKVDPELLMRVWREWREAYGE